MGRTAALTWRQYRTLLEVWSDRYLSSPAALRLDGRPALALLNLTDFCATYGTATFEVMLRYARVTVRRRTGEDPYLLGLLGQVAPTDLALADALDLDGVTGYGLLPTWGGPPVQDYAALVERRVREWHWLQARLRRPFLPVVCCGWDATVRGEGTGRLRPGDGYPAVPVVTGADVETFERFLDAALAFDARWHPEHDVVFLHAWNEWTESSAIEPSDRWGDAYLAAVRARAGKGTTVVTHPLRPDGVVAPD